MSVEASAEELALQPELVDAPGCDGVVMVGDMCADARVDAQSAFGAAVDAATLTVVGMASEVWRIVANGKGQGA